MTQAQTLDTLRRTGPAEANMPAISMGFGSLQSFEFMQRAAKMLANSTMVPVQYRALVEKKGRDGSFTVEENPNAISNCVIALNMANRIGADPLMVMQNLYLVEGRPSWSSQFIIAAINACGRYTPLRFDLSEPGEEQSVPYTVWEWNNNTRKKEPINKTIKVRERTCVAWAIEKGTNQRLESPVISMSMAVQEGWLQKAGSKWQTMPEMMLRYRAAAFFGKFYAPELLMGIQTAEENQDIIDVTPDTDGVFAAPAEPVKTTVESLREQRGGAAVAAHVEAPEQPRQEQAAPARSRAPRQQQEKPAAAPLPSVEDNGPPDDMFPPEDAYVGQASKSPSAADIAAFEEQERQRLAAEEATTQQRPARSRSRDFNLE